MELLDRVRATGLLPAGRPVVVLLSGGRDSVCLLDVAVALAGRTAVQALHVNYGLREDAAGDEQHCQELCDGLRVLLTVERATRRPPTGNLQAWARGVRLGLASEIAYRWFDGAKVATGHTATDQVETVLYRLAASPGRRALLGMRADDGVFVRPLLQLTREDTGAWCRARGLAWREDASNADPTFARTRVREELVPALRALHPAAERNVLRTAELLRDEAEVLDDVVDTALADQDHIAVVVLRALPQALARLVLRRLAEDVVGGLCARAPGRLDDVLALGDDGALDLGDGARAVVERGVLRVERTPPLPERRGAESAG